MNTSPRHLLGSLLLILGGLALASPARAADAVVAYQFPSADTAGMSAQTAPGVGGCLLVCGGLRLATGAAIPARRQGMLAFSAPAGTTIVNATIRLRYRTKQPSVSAHLMSRIGGRWIDGRRLRSAGGTTATVSAGRGASAVAVTLTADGAVPARAVRSEGENVIAVSAVQLTVRDLSAPSVSWATGDPATGTWQRGVLCGGFAARDTGLGVDRVEYTVGGVQAVTQAGTGTRLQPRPLALDGSVCLDTHQVGDGTFGSALTAVDTGADGNRSATLSGLVRIDNTPPAVQYTAPTDLEARLPEAQLVIADATSGIEQITASVDGLPAVLGKSGGVMTIRPPAPLEDGLHRISWEVSDVAGNVTTGSELLGIADATPPTIDTAEPQAIAAAMAGITVRATDTGAGISTEDWRLAVDGSDVTGAADLSTPGVIAYLPARPWTEGEHVVRVTVVDRSGNRTVRTWTFAVPVTPPSPASPPLPAVIETAQTAPEVLAAPASEPVESTVVRTTLRLRAATPRVRVGGQVRLRGRLTGSRGPRVRIEARVGRTWRMVVAVPVSPSGSFATPVRLPAPGTYDVRARVGSTVSPTVRLTAR